MRTHPLIAVLPLAIAVFLMIAWSLMVHPIVEARKESSRSTSGTNSQQDLSSTRDGVEETRHQGSSQRWNSNMQNGTFIKRLEHAPYPYTGKYEDTNVDFFDHIDPRTGERFHTNRYGDRFSEREHYTDGSVLFHIPPHFNPDKSFTYVVFFHAIQTDILATNRTHLLDRQMDNSGQNVILVMPQLARNAADSSPGKFFRRNAFRAFMDEAADVLAQVVGKEYRNKLGGAPIILSAFSGGYKAAAFALDRGGVDGRVRGAFLMDALYDDVEKFQKWIVGNIKRGFFLSIFTSGSCEKNSRELAFRLGQHLINARAEWPGKISKGEAYFIFTPTEHMQIPLLGPPEEPLADLLRRLDLNS